MILIPATVATISLGQTSGVGAVAIRSDYPVGLLTGRTFYVWLKTDAGTATASAILASVEV